MPSLLFTLLYVHVMALAAIATAAPSLGGIRPQAVVLILADDLGFNMVGFHNSTVLSPNIDDLASNGIKLGSFFVQPICSPTRSALMTGRYTYRLGTQATVIRADVPFGVPLRETYLSQNMKDAGLGTALFGKWHLGFYQSAYLPLQRGFDEHLGYYQGAVHYYTHQGGGYDHTTAGMDWHRGNETDCFADTGTYTAPLILAEATGYMKRMAAKKQPFFLYLPFHLVHGPNEVDDQYKQRYPNIKNKATQTVLGMVSALDDHVKLVVDALKETNLYESSFLLFFGDNGAQQGQTGDDFHGSWPLKGWKTQLWEGGTHVPAFVHSPLLPKALLGTTNHRLFHVVDVLPTLVNLVGGNTKRNLPLDGFDMMPAILDPATKGANARTEMLYTLNGACGRGYVNPNSALRIREMKVLVDCFNITTQSPQNGSRIWLHNLTADPYEQTNLATPPMSAENAQVLKTLLGRLADYARSKDQYLPTLFPEEAAHCEPGDPQCPNWNFQCPQCPQGGAFPSKSWPANGTTAPNTFNPWCNRVTCGKGPPAPPKPTPPPPVPTPAPQPTPAPAPTPQCPTVNSGCWFSQSDVGTTQAANWTACCADCAATKNCTKWVWRPVGHPSEADRCHLHSAPAVGHLQGQVSVCGVLTRSHHL